MASDLGPEIPSPAEATDGAELGEETGDQVLPGTVEFPPIRPAGVGPSGSFRNAEHHDSLADRADRTMPEEPPPPHDTIMLVETAAADYGDDEAQAIGDEAPTVGVAGPEEAALHYEADGDDDDVQYEADGQVPGEGEYPSQY